MTKISSCVLAATAALVIAACGGDAPASHENAPPIAEETAPAAPTKDALVALEKSAYEAWKSRDEAFWETFLSDKFVGYGASGKLDKASAKVEYVGADCEIASWSISDEQMRQLGDDVALLTHKTMLEGTCGGQAVPAESWAATVYVREGDRWQGAFHAEAPIVDPEAAPATPVGEPEATPEGEARAAAGDAGTDAMLAAERALWEAWRAHDAETIESLTTEEFSFINIFGTYFANKADAIADWTGTGCDVESVSVTDATGTMLSPTVGILTFTGGADGTCYGQEVGPIRGTSIYVQDGEAWKWTFGINLPAPGGAEAAE